MKIFGKKGAGRTNDDRSSSTVRYLRGQTEALGFAMRAHSANN